MYKSSITRIKHQQEEFSDVGYLRLRSRNAIMYGKYTVPRGGVTLNEFWKGQKWAQKERYQFVQLLESFARHEANKQQTTQNQQRAKQIDELATNKYFGL